MNLSKIKDERFWEKWKDAGSVKGFGYSEELMTRLTYAEEYAKVGNVATMKYCIHSAKSYAAKTNKDISEEISRIEKICYYKVIAVQLKEAEEYAKADDVYWIICIDFAKHYAAEIGKDISEEVSRIRNLL
jgi:hypothetical protein